MIIYLIKSSGLLLLFYVFYLVISQEKRLQFNRFYLLGSLVFAYLLPVFDWRYVLEEPIDDSHYLIGEAYSYVSVAGVGVLSTIESVNDQTNWNLWNSLYVVIIIGAMVMLLRFTRNLISLFRVIKSSDFRREEHHVFVLVDKRISPYSFLKYILLSREDYCGGSIADAIIQHELSHVKQLHSLDIILIELLSIPFWFNPILWEYGKAIRANHEYLADESVTQQIDIRSYSELLVHEIQKNTISLFGSNFNFF